MKDVRWMLLIIAGVFVIWVATGGPARLDMQGIFLKPPAPLSTGETYGGEIGTPTYRGKFVPPSTYRATNTKYFTVALPSGWTFEESENYGNYYSGVFSNGKTILTFDYGSAPSPLPVPEEDYVIVSEKVDKATTKFVYPKKSGDGVTGAYYKRTFGKDLTIAGDNLTRAEQNTAFTIMRSVDFK